MPQNQEIQALKVSEPLVGVSSRRPQTDGSNHPHGSGKPWQLRHMSSI